MQYLKQSGSVDVSLQYFEKFNRYKSEGQNPGKKYNVEIDDRYSLPFGA
jgi:hypothetical protein